MTLYNSNEAMWRHIRPTGIAPVEVHVWRASLIRTSTHLKVLQQLLSYDEVRRSERFHFVRDRHQFIAGRGQLRLLLGHYLRCRPESLRFEYSNFGKPTLLDETDLNFNVSHSGEFALYTFAYRAEIGVDIEVVKPDFPIEDIAQYYFSPAEISALMQVSPNSRNIAFFNCWTRKEAYIKAQGEGLSIPLDSFDVSVTPDEPASLLETRDNRTNASEWSLYHLQPAPEYVGALAIRGRNWRLSLYDYKGLFPL